MSRTLEFDFCQQLKSVNHERLVQLFQEEKNSLLDQLDELDLKLNETEADRQLKANENLNLRHDVHQLVNMVGQLRRGGAVDFRSVDLRTVAFETVFGSFDLVSTIASSDEILKRHVDELKTQIVYRDQLIDDLRSQLAKAKSHADSLSAKNAQNERELGVFKENINNSFHKEQLEVIRCTDKDMRIRAMSFEMDLLNDRVKELESAVDERSEAVCRLEREIADYLSTIQLQKTEIFSLRQQVESSTVALKNRALDRSVDGEKTGTAGSSQNDWRRSRLESPDRSELARLRSRCADLETELNVVTEKWRTANAQLAELSTKATQLDTKTELVDKLRTELDERNDLISQLRADAIKLEHGRGKLELTNSKLEDKCRRLEGQLSAMDDRCRGDVEALKEQLAERDLDVSKLRDKLATAEMRAEKLNNLAEQLRDSNNDERSVMNIELQEKIGQLKSLRAEYNDLEARHQDVRIKLTQAEAVRDRLKADNDELRLRTEELDNKVRTAEIDVLENQSKYIEQVDYIDSEMETCKRLLREKELDYDAVERRLEEFRLQHEALVDSEKSLQSLVASLQSENSRLNNELASSTNRLEIVTAEFDEYKSRTTAELKMKTESEKLVQRELIQAKQALQTATTERGRLESRLEAWKLSADVDRDTVSDQLREKEDITQVLQEQLDAAKEQRRQLETALSQQKVELTDLETELQLKKDELNRCVGQLESAKAELDAEREQVVQRDNQIELMGRELNLATQELLSANERCESMETASEEQLAELEKTRLELTKLHNSYVQSVATIDEQTALLDAANVNLDVAHRHNAELAAQLDELQLTCVSHERNCDVMQLSLDDKNKLIDDLEQQLSELKEAASQLRGLIDERDRDVVELTNERDQLSGQLEQVSVELSEQRTKLAATELQLTSIQERHKTSQKEVGLRDETIVQLRMELQSATAKYSGGVEQIEMTERELDRLRGKLKQQMADTRAATNRAEMAEDTLAECERRLQLAEERCECVRQELENEQQTVEQQRHDVQAEKAIMTEELRRLKNDAQGLRLQIEDCNRDYDQLRDKLLSVEAELQAERQRTEEAVSAGRQQEQRVETLTGQLRQRDDAVDRLNQRIVGLEADNKAVGVRLESAQAELDELRSHYENVRLENDRLAEKNATLKQNTILAEEQRALLEGRVELAESENERLRQTLSDRENELHINEQRCAETDRQLQQNSQLLEVEQQRIVQLEVDIDTLRADLADLGAVRDELVVRRDQVLDELRSYQERHVYSNDEVMEKESAITRAHTDLEQLRQELCRQQQLVADLKQANTDLRVELAGAHDGKLSVERQLAVLEEQVAIERGQAADTQRKASRELAALEEECSDLETTLKTSKTRIVQLEEELAARQSSAERSHNELQTSREQLNKKINELSECESVLADVKAELEVAERDKSMVEEKLVEFQREQQALAVELTETRTNFRETAAQLADLEEKFSLQSHKMERVQEQLSQKVGECVRLEQLVSKHHSEMRLVKEHRDTADQELAETRLSMEQLKADLCRSKDDVGRLQQELYAQKQAAAKSKIELDGIRGQQSLMSQQMDSQEQLVVQLQSDLSAETAKCRDYANKAQQYRRDLQTLQTSQKDLERQLQDVLQRANSKDQQLTVLSTELEQVKEKYYESRSELADVQGRLRLAEVDVNAAKVAAANLDDASSRFDVQLGAVNEEKRQLTRQLNEIRCELADVRLQLSAAEGSSQEAMEQLASKTNEVRELRDKLENANKLLAATKTESGWRDKRAGELDSELANTKEKLSAVSNDLAERDRQLSRLQERLKETETQLSSREAELDTERMAKEHTESKYSSELRILQETLDGVRQNELQLRGDSGEVVRTFYQYLDDQKRTNERLVDKIKQLQMELQAVRSEKEQLISKTKQLNSQLTELEVELRRYSNDYEQLKRHSENQQVVLKQLQARLVSAETERDAVLTKVASTSDDGGGDDDGGGGGGGDAGGNTAGLYKQRLRQVENLHLRLKDNVNNVAKLQAKLSELERENVAVTEQLRLERDRRQQLEAGRTSTEPAASPTGAEDKQFWMRRVGELSVQLQKSSEYWSEKVKGLQLELDRVRLKSR